MTNLRTVTATIALCATYLTLPAPGARAADLSGNCCADLEERIAELEATTARKGNRNVSLTVAGHINRAVMFWDDGREDGVYSVGNKNDQTNFSFTGDAKIAPGWVAGYELVIRVRDSLSDDVSQDIDDGTGENFQIWQSHWYVASESYGKLSVGLASRVSDTAAENDLSEAGVAGYAGVQDIGGAFALRRSDGTLIDIASGDLGNHFNGDTANVVRYDTPEYKGFIASASFGEDDIWDVGLKYSGEGGGFQTDASIAYTEVKDNDGVFADIDHSTLLGSIAILHQASGLNALIAAGDRSFDEQTVDADGVARDPKNARFIYAKLGWIAKLNTLGPTAFYGEYGHFKNYLTVQSDGLEVELGGAAGDRITGSTLDVWGLGVVQHIEAAEMQLYVGYRNHQADFDLVSSGGAVAPAGIDDFHTVISGAKIGF